MSKTLNKEIKDALESNKAILGLKRTLKEKDLKKIVYASNCSKVKFKMVSPKKKIETEKYEGTNMDLGELCKKPFAVSVLSIKSK